MKSYRNPMIELLILHPGDILTESPNFPPELPGGGAGDHMGDDPGLF